jgi:adenylyl-sulfate reductase (glutathione)
MEEQYAELAREMAGSSLRVAKFHADIERDFSSATFGLKTFPTIVFMGKSTPGFVKYPSERRDAATLGAWVKTLATVR